jgi:PAS domain S-box-containing protein
MQQFHELDDTWVRCLFNESPIPMALVAADNRFSRLNDTFCSLVGYGRAELLARTWQSITHPDDIAGDEAGANALRLDHHNDVYTITKRYISKAGVVVWVDLHVRAVWDGETFVCHYVIACPCHRPEPAAPAQPSRPLSYVEWIKANPKDAALLGTAAVAILGRDALIELVKALLSLK